MTIPSIQNLAQATESSLNHLKSALAQKKTYSFVRNDKGAVEISLNKLGLWDRIKDWFTHSQRKLAKSFIDQTLNTVSNENVDKSLRRMILLNVDDKNATTEIFNKVIKKAHVEKKKEVIHVKFLSAYHLIQPVSHRKEAEAFQAKFARGEPVTLWDSRPFVEYHWEQRLNAHLGYPDVLSQLRTYFTDSHQASGFEEIEVAAKKAVFESHKGQLFSSDLSREIVKDIKNKASQHPSIHGHPRDLYTLEDFENLKEILVRAPNLQEAADQLRKMDESVEKSNQTLQKYSSLFQRLEGGKATPSLIIEAKKALMQIDQTSGRYVGLDLLLNHPSTSSKNKIGLENLIALDQMRGSHIDQAMMQSFVDEHSSAFTHPRVAIEGAGPTGLLLAITQYRSGADVSIFEKRSTKFDRTQIVRLDPQWMTMLKLYLGEDYYKLFVDPGKKGILRSDGFGEISTMELEDVLHKKLTELISIVPVKKGEIPSLERLAAHEIVQVKSPASQGGKFQIIADYSERYDAADAPEYPSSDHQIRQIDMLICAGGKSSPMKEKLLPSSIAVNNKQNYGVCSWTPRRILEQNPDKMDIFDDFRNMIKVDQGFRNQFQAKLSAQFTKDSLVGTAVSGELLEGFNEQMNSLEFQNFMRNGPSQPFIQTRTFENLGLVYIGMEMPVEVAALFKNFEGKIDHIISKGNEEILEKQKQVEELIDRLETANIYLADADTESRVSFYQKRKGALDEELHKLLSELEILSPGHGAMIQHKQFMMEMMRKVWFQTIMDTYGMSEKHGLTMDTIDAKFAAMFPVDQNRLHQNHAFSNIKAGSSELLVLAAGDAFASPHFMRYSGLTGARENILDYQDYTYNLTHHRHPDQSRLFSKLSRNADRTASFVVERGKAFLTPKTQAEIDKARKDKMIAILDKDAGLRKISEGRYEILKGFKRYVIQAHEGYLTVDGSPRNYQSLEQIKLGRGLV